jgi:hypothetical protein
VGNRKTDDLGDDDATADIDLVEPTALAENRDPLDPAVSTSLSFSAEAEASAPPPGPPKKVPWAPLVARLQESGLMPPDPSVSEADEATVVRPATQPRALMASMPSAVAPSPFASSAPSLASSLPAPPVPFATLPPSSAVSSAPAGVAPAGVAPAGVRPLGASAADPLPDTIGRYRILRRLNTGDASDVLLAQSAGPGGFSKWVVIKRVLPHLADDERAVDMFLREARIAARLNHSAIVQTYELGEDIARGQRGYFIAMEYIDGLSLTDIAQKTWSQGKSLPLELIASAIGDIALGLHYAHELSDENGDAFGLVHRDVCPENVLVTKTGDAKLVDFGVATMAALTRFTRDGELRIKIPYTAPEQLKSEEIDGRADLYSLGVSLYWLSTAVLPFAARGSMMLMQQVTSVVPPPPSAHNAALPSSFDDLVMKLLSKKPDDRYGNGEELYEALIDAVPSSKNDVVSFWADVVSPFAAPRTNPGALPKPGVPAARLRRAMR